MAAVHARRYCRDVRRWRSFELPSPLITRAAADAVVVTLVLGSFLADLTWDRPGAAGWQWALAALLTSGALLFRRRFALAVLIGILALWLAVHTPDAAEDPAFQFMALLVATYALGAHASRRQGIVGLLVAAASFSALNLLRGEDIFAAIAGSIQFSVMFIFGVLVGGAATRERVLREQAAQLEVERDERARSAAEEERRRIARDLHDSLGHTISAIVLQVAAVRRRLGEDQRTEHESLLAVERSGRDSVTELRRMLGMLREQPSTGLEPLPSLARVEELARSVRSAGVAVEVHLEGDQAGVPPGVDVAAYRIVQEALTNVLKHAHDAQASVRVTCLHDCVTLEVTDDGNGARHANGDHRPGQGLIGMRERVALYGGEFEAGPRSFGGFIVTARLPFDGSPG